MRKVLVVLLLAAAGAAAAGYFYPPVRLLAQKAVGRSPTCPTGLALKAAGNLKEQIRIKDEILKASKLLENDPAGYHLFQTPHGRFWIPKGDDWVLPFNLAEQVRGIYGSGETGVRSGDVVVDCGANVGTFTRFALNRGAGLVIGFEPSPENIESYRRNFRDEIAAGKVILVPKGVWDKEDVLLLKRDPTNSAADSFIMLKDGSHGVQAPLTTVDRALAELKVEKVDYIKMDVEGAEEKALTGARNTITKYHPRLSIATEHLPTDEVRLPAAIRNMWSGYEMICGPCMETDDGHIRPDVLYFR